MSTAQGVNTNHNADISEVVRISTGFSLPNGKLLLLIMSMRFSYLYEMEKGLNSLFGENNVNVCPRRNIAEDKHFFSPNRLFEAFLQLKT